MLHFCIWIFIQIRNKFLQTYYNEHGAMKLHLSKESTTLANSEISVETINK